MNNYPILNIAKSNLNEFIDYWSNIYAYDQRFNEKLYQQNINADPIEKDNIEQLFLWKNGMNLSANKTSSLSEKILTKLELINHFRIDVPDFDIIRNTFKNVSAIWLIFLAHIISPKKYPIFDQHVYRAYSYLTTGKIKGISNYDKEKLEIYEKEYLPFFNQNLRNVKDYKKLDEAMWSFGRNLKVNKALFSA